MKKSIVLIGVLIAGMLMIPSTLRADPAQTAAYEQCVENYIARLDRQKDLVDSRSEALRACREEARERAELYRANTDLLSHTMEMEHVKPSEPHVEYFLIKSYHAALAHELG